MTIWQNISCIPYRRKPLYHRNTNLILYKIGCCNPELDGNLCNDRIYLEPAEWKEEKTSPELNMAIVIGISVTLTLLIFFVGGFVHRYFERKKKGKCFINMNEFIEKTFCNICTLTVHKNILLKFLY